MASLKEIKGRINAIGSTKKITKAMELVATAKLQRTRKNLVGVDVYAENVLSFFQDLMLSVADIDKLIPTPVNQGTLFVLITSDVGLCGGYNNQVLRHFNEQFRLDHDRVIVVGSKGQAALSAKKIKPLAQFDHLSDYPSYSIAAEMAKLIWGLYLSASVSAVVVLANHFVNTIVTAFEPFTLLPLARNRRAASSLRPLTEFEPSAEVILRSALPLYLGALLYQKLVSAKVAENVARRVAMESATDNATELIDQLSIVYNRVRQAKITQEISEIVAGAEAN